MATDLERFVSAEGRDEQIAAVRRKIEDSGVTYVYYQFPSVTGRIMGKGVPAKHWESMAHKGFQLVYGATANLFVDRLGEYIGYGPESAELVGLPEPETFQVLPWDSKVARVWCICFRGREDLEDGGAFLTSDCRGNLQRIQAQFESEHGPAPARRHRARDDVAQAERRRHAVRRGALQALLLPHRPVQRVPADHPQGDRVLERHGPRHDPGRPRGRAGPARAELQLRSRRAHRRQPLDLPAGLPPGRPRARRLPVLHAEALHGRVGERLPPQHLAVARRRERLRAQGGRGPADAVADRPLRDRRHPRAPRCADRGHGVDGQLVPPSLGHRLLGAGLRGLGLPEPHHRAARVGARAASSTARSTRRSTRTSRWPR